jgi:hypothetical protein
MDVERNMNATIRRNHEPETRTMNATKTYELASQDTHGGWEHCGDFESREDAIEAAKTLAPNCHHDDSGMVVFGLSDDPDSGHYQERLGLFFEAGQYTLVDPLP